MLSEKIELLGKGLYRDIPNELTLKAFPTVTELDYVGSEDFDRTMLDVIFPKCIEEKINFRNLLEIDYMWICRGLRFLNYGPFFTTNTILCEKCGPVKAECQVDLRAVGCKALPEGFTNDIVVGKDDLIDFDKEIHLHLLTINEALALRKDNLFKRADGEYNTSYARMCYSITSIGNIKDITPVSAKLEIESKLSNADMKALNQIVEDLTDYGLRGGGRCQCPKCKSTNAAFIALADDRFFRPTLGDLKQGRNYRSVRGEENTAGSKTEAV